MPDKPSLTDEEAALRLVMRGTEHDGPTNAWKYGEAGLGTGATISYSWLPFEDLQFNGSIAAKLVLNESQREGLRMAMDAIEDIANVTFVEADNAFSDEGDINFQGQVADWGNSSKVGSWTEGDAAQITGSLVTMGATAPNVFQPYNLRYSVHEILHAIGLPHPGAYDLNINDLSDRPTYEDDAEYREDTTQYTVMSYFGGQHTGGFNWRPGAASLMLHDVMALDILYGANETAFSGNTRYGFNSNAGREWWSLDGASDRIFGAIWDTGGTDWIDVSEYSAGSDVDLRQGNFSSLGGTSNNVSIAPGVVIENAAGGFGDDLLIGNQANNRLVGGSGADTLRGSGGNDTLLGQGGDDWIRGGAGTDVMNGGAHFDVVDFSYIGGALLIDLPNQTALQTNNNVLHTYVNFEGAVGGNGNDTLLGGSTDNYLAGHGGWDVIIGHTGNDTLLGGAGQDTLYGGIGNDSLTGNRGPDTLNGGAGQDTVDFSETLVGVEIDLAARTAVMAGTTDTLILIEHATGGAANDRILGDNGPNTLVGGDGNDELNGRSGSDNLRGGTGNDSLRGGIGNDTLYGGDGNDTLAGGVGIDWQYGGLGIDLVRFDHSDDDWIVDLSASRAQRTGEVSIEVVSEIEQVLMGGGDDIVRGSDAMNTLRGGAGNDTIYGLAMDDTLRGEAGDDHLNGDSGSDRILGGGGNDSLDGGSGRDDLRGHEGDDWISGGFGIDTLNGGNGVDTADYSYSSGGFRLHLADEEAVLLSGSGVEQMLNFENAIGSRGSDIIIGTVGANMLSGGRGNDSIDGSSGHDDLSGNSGNDTLNGGSGNDFVSGGAGIDLMSGGLGNDTVNYGGSNRDWELNLSVGIALRGDGVMAEAITDFENAISGLGADSLLGSDGANRLESGAGRDRLQGQDGNDTLVAGGDHDSLFGGNGHDRMFGGGGHDSLDGGNGHDRLKGGNGNDTLIGGGGEDSIFGGGGNDMIIAGFGLDIHHGGAGNDTVDYGYSADNWVFLLGATGSATRVGGGSEQILQIENLLGSRGNDIVTGDQSANYVVGNRGDDSVSGAQGDDTLLGGAGEDRMIGGAGDDLVRGDAGNDFVNGGLGADTIWGGTGNDTMVGGGDRTSDVFIFSDAGGFDLIRGFEQGTDVLWLDDALWDPDFYLSEKLVKDLAVLDSRTGEVVFDFGRNQLTISFVDPVDMTTLHEDIVLT